MKHIVKAAEPESFAEWKRKRSSDWEPRYGELRGQEKQALKAALMEEQGFICCYCERRLIEDDSHIEHLRPQREPESDALDYGNMLCSCQQATRRAEPRHCGTLKGSWFDRVLLVSPLDPTCEERFIYLGDGSIQPRRATDRGAATTIGKLGLNIPKLRAYREEAIEPFLDPSLSEAERDSFVHHYLLRDDQGHFSPFHTTIEYLLRK